MRFEAGLCFVGPVPRVTGLSKGCAIYTIDPQATTAFLEYSTVL